MPTSTASKPATVAQVLKLSEAQLDAVGRLVSRIVELEKRIGELEKQPAMVAAGYKDGDRYLPGAWCERNGALYKSVRSTREKPGETDHWQAVSATRIHYGPMK